MRNYLSIPVYDQKVREERFLAQKLFNN